MAQRTPPMEGPGRGPGSGSKSGWAARHSPNANADSDIEDWTDLGSNGNNGAPKRDVVAGGGQGASEAAALSLQPTRPSASDGPFVWQYEQQLLLLDEEMFGWTLAELRFDARLCHYVEVRRARYRWPREAAGALLCRVLNLDDAKVEQTADDLHRWIVAHQNASTNKRGQPST